MTDLEKKQEELAKKFEAGTLGSTDSTDIKKNRERLVRTWVGNFFSVKKYVNQAKKDNVSIASKKELMDYIVAQWESNSSDEDEAVKELFAA